LGNKLELSFIAASQTGLKRWLAHLCGMAAIAGLLAGCANSAENEAYQGYRKDHRAAMREVVRCQSNYAAIGQTPQCRAALRVNAELFPVHR
jgi:hypothetical protein